MRRERPRSRLRFEQLEDRRLLAGSPWQNPVEPMDVSSDNFVAAQDVLIVVNELNTPTYAVSASGMLPARTDTSAPYFDVDGNSFVSALDALIVINFLNTPAPELGLSIAPASVSESAGGGAAVGTVTRTGPTTEAVTVSLASSDLSEASAPASVTIPAGASSATFSVTAHNDTAVDGVQRVTFTASASGYTSSQAALDVTDDDAHFEAFVDFGSATSPLSAGFKRVSNTTQYSAAQGYGWSSGVVYAGDRGAGGDVERDFNYTQDATFVIDVPNGSYQVDLLLGDKVYAHDLAGVYLEGTQVASVTTAAKQIVNRRFNVQVNDGQLTLRLKDLGGSDAYAVVEGLRVLSAGTQDIVSNAWWPARDGIDNALFSQRSQLGVYHYYTVDSNYQASSNNIRVLLPAGYDARRDYPVIYVLPVELGNRTQFGDGMTTIVSNALQKTTDAIFVSPTFSYHPWYADNAFDSTVWQETYFKDVIVPFIEEQYPVIDGPDGRLLLGFSKSGYGAVAMLLRNPDYFGRVVAWDSPLAMSNPASGWGFVNVLGSVQNFEDNYRITKLLQKEGHRLKGGPARIFLQGYSYGFTYADHSTVHDLMTSLNIPHTYNAGVYRAHVWASGWMPGAVDALMAGV